MKTHTPSVVTAAISLVAALALMTQATAEDVDTVTGTPAVRLQPGTSVEYVNGGAGEQERAAMRPLQNEFPLHIVFSARDGAYGVADEVRVMKAGETIAVVPQAGPLLLLKLAPGTYTVEADAAGRTERRNVTVGPTAQTLQWAVASSDQP